MILIRRTGKGKEILAVCFLLVVALLIRANYFLGTEIENPVRGDAFYYLTYASNLSKYGVFSQDYGSISPKADSYRTPGYPVFITMIFKSAEILNLKFYSALMISQIILGSITVWLTYLLGKIILSKSMAFFSALLTAISPHLISLGNYILTETLFTFLLILSVYIFMHFYKRCSLLIAICSGVGFGFAYLVNPVMLFTPIILVIMICASSQSPIKKKHLMSAIYFLLAFLLIVVMWHVRNLHSVEEGKQSSVDRMYMNLVIGSHRDFYDYYRLNPRDPNNPATRDHQATGGSIISFLDLLSERVVENPIDYAKWYFLEKPYLLWSWNILVGQGDIHVYPVNNSLYDKNTFALASYSFMKSAHPWILLFSLVGVLFVFRKERGSVQTSMAIIYMVLASISLVYVVLQSEPRYSVPLRPFLYLSAFYFISEVANIYKNYRTAYLNRLDT